jgi:hypothetical protein
MSKPDVADSPEPIIATATTLLMIGTAGGFCGDEACEV